MHPKCWILLINEDDYHHRMIIAEFGLLLIRIANIAYLFILFLIPSRLPSDLGYLYLFIYAVMEESTVLRICRIDRSRGDVCMICMQLGMIWRYSVRQIQITQQQHLPTGRQFILLAPTGKPWLNPIDIDWYSSIHFIHHPGLALFNILARFM